ncbi:MAG: NADH-quinone oxidoreductase subunit L [Rhodospirillales bacterium]|nr:NADH-quinone oxidoreductase subunit L [Rhodospirillales bacterium]MCB9995597.1 NADH-quinone oxidoreductase subunit L [Rhodospirillales bacterium]
MEILAVFPPLFAFLLAGLFGKQIGAAGAQFVTCAAVILSAFCSVVLFFDVVFDQDPRTVVLAGWIASGDFSVNWALRVDQLTAVMLCVINIVSSCVHVYSIGYMSHDPCKGRFMAYLSLFTFAMLMLVTADNLLQLFFGWEGVGLASYLLIGFWNHKNSANAAAVKAFVVNRVGDFGLALGVMATFFVFGTVEFEAIFDKAPELATHTFNFLGYELHSITVITLLLFIGACGKSAQLGLHTWLPDAMEGPTPVSALIHAATMVTAGVFLMARFSPVLEYAPLTLQVICIVGGLTAFVAATIGLTQFDIKRVIAYSTMSQLGYMFFAIGVSAYGAAIFHLMTHAFFKALLFLGAGSVIHAMSDEQDMRKMGGIYKMIPFTYGLMWIGSLALAGIPLFAGYYSKDIILESAFADHTWFGNFAFWLGIAAALMTAFYSWRLILMTFHGKPRADEKVMAHVHESPAVMLSPLVVLATGALFAGAVFYEPFVAGDHHEPELVAHEVELEREVEAPTYEGGHEESVWNRHAFWGESLKVLHENDTVQAAHHVPEWVKLLPLFMGLGGIFLAYVIYMWREGVAQKLAAGLKPLYNLSFNKWYFDELYQKVFVESAWGLGRFFSVSGDRKIIDRYGPDGVASASAGIAGLLQRFQSGYMYQYAFVMIIAVIGLMSWFVFRTGM